MADLLLFIFLLGLVALAVVGGWWMLRGYLGQSPMVMLFGDKAEKRLAVVEHASVDGRRRLVLIRRDNVEHLIMTGGPVDVLIEQNIGAEPKRASEAVGEGNGAVLRPARTFGRLGKAPEAAAE